MRKGVIHKQMNKFILSVILALSTILLPGCGNQPQNSSGSTETQTSGTMPENSASSLPQSSIPESTASSVTESAAQSQPESTADENTALSALQDSISEQSAMLGAGLLGYADSESGEAAVRELVADSALGKTYSFLADCELVLCEGSELYTLVPAKDTAVTIYPSEISEEGYYIDRRNAPIYNGVPGEPLILRCNFSDIYSNVLVEVTDGKNTMEYRPMISLRNGRIAQQEGCYDFSVYGYDPVESAQELLLSCDEVRASMERGMKLLFTGDVQFIEGCTCYVFAVGTDSDGQFVREQLYAASDDIIYAYSVLSDSWEMLIAE